jgi:hypothetical protein
MKDENYLNDRGFKILERSPNQTDIFPYLRLKKVRKHPLCMSEIKYCSSSTVSSETFKSYHPSNGHSDYLIKLIENEIIYSAEFEGNIFTTSPGIPIKIFVEDKEWLYIAQKLVEKYSKT